MRPTSSIIEEKPERFSLSYDRIYLIGSVSCKWRYHHYFEIIAVASAGSVNDVASIYHWIHSLLGDGYCCVNHACGAINPFSRVEYLRRKSAIQQSLIRARHILWRDMTIHLMCHVYKEFSESLLAALAKSYPRR